MKNKAGNDGVKNKAYATILAMREHQHFIHDDFQRGCYDNFLSGYESAYRLLTGEKI